MNEEDKKNLEKLRDEIDRIDSVIVDSINSRTNIVLKIGEIKNKYNVAVYSPSRERDVYDKVLKKNHGPINNASLEAVYREIMSASLALEKNISVGYLGPEGSFSHQACIRKFGSSIPFTAYKTIADVFKAVDNGECDYGIVPVENSTEGGVNDTLDMFVDTKLKICSEIAIPVKHNLLSLETDIHKIKKVYSIIQVLGQCRQWLLAHMPNAELVEVSSSSRAAQMASQDASCAAIASELCARLYNLNILNKSIQDVSVNVTRFAVLSNENSKKTGKDKTSLLLFLKDKVGALYDTLLFFKSHCLNLSRIESRPSKKRPWEYYFYIDFLGHIDDLKVKDLIKNLKEHCELVKVLGLYPLNKEFIENESA